MKNSNDYQNTVKELEKKLLEVTEENLQTTSEITAFKVTEIEFKNNKNNLENVEDNLKKGLGFNLCQLKYSIFI